jgi:spore coat polysaccharide biosynthesis protein SpsF (cytidylyltransferase family)
MGSTRLPRKALLSLRGKPVLQWIVERQKTARLPDLILLATTTSPEDDELASFASSLGIEVFRGEPEDILVRWRDAGRAYSLDLLVCCDGDDVMADAAHVDRVISCFEETRADVISVVGLPFGGAPFGYSLAGLERVCALKKETATEGQGRFFEDPSIVSRAEVIAPESVRHEGVRMTLDYPDDARFFEAVIEELDEPGRVFSMEEIVALLHRRPDIVAINSGLQEEYWARFNERYPPVELSGE